MRISVISVKKITLLTSSLNNRGKLRDSLNELAIHLNEDLTTLLLNAKYKTYYDVSNKYFMQQNNAFKLNKII